MVIGGLGIISGAGFGSGLVVIGFGSGGKYAAIPGLVTGTDIGLRVEGSVVGTTGSIVEGLE